MLEFSFLKKYLFYFLSVTILLAKYIPHTTNQFHSYFPLIEVSFIFFFYVFKTNYVPYLLLFMVSIILDSINGNVIGSTAIVIFLTLYLFEFQRKLFWYHNFKEIWVGFFVFLLEFNAIQILIYFLINNKTFDFLNLFYVNIITLLIYPVLHNMFYALSLLLDKNYDSK